MFVAKTTGSRQCSAYVVHIKANQTRGFAEQEHQYTGRQRIKRAEMADLTETRQVPDGVHHVVRRAALRLVDDKRAVEGRSCLWFPWHLEITVVSNQ